MLVTLAEIIRATLLSLILGWLFMDLIPPASRLQAEKRFWLSVASVAPAVILHELAHKLVALSLGLQATLQVPWLFVLLAVILKLARSPFIFIVPAFVSMQGVLTPFTIFLTALAGPLMNLILAGVFWLLERSERVSRASYEMLVFIHVSMQINLFLGIFNLLPIPGFDGSKVAYGLIRMLTG